MSVRYYREPISHRKKMTSFIREAFDKALVLASSGVLIGLQSTISARSKIVKA